MTNSGGIGSGITQEFEPVTPRLSQVLSASARVPLFGALRRPSAGPSHQQPILVLPLNFLTHLLHCLQFQIAPANQPFYKSLMHSSISICALILAIILPPVNL